MNRLSIYELAQVLVEKNGLDRHDAEHFVSAIFNIVQLGLERDSVVKIKGLGTFKIIGVEARESVNVNTGERVVIESHEKVTFTPDAIMKELVNKPFSQFETVVLNEGVEFDDMRGGDITAETDAATLEDANATVGDVTGADGKVVSRTQESTDDVDSESVDVVNTGPDTAPTSNSFPLIESALDDIKEVVDNMDITSGNANDNLTNDREVDKRVDVPRNVAEDNRMAIVDDVEDVPEETVVMTDKNVLSPSVTPKDNVISDGKSDIGIDEVAGSNIHREDDGKPNEEQNDIAAEVEETERPIAESPKEATAVSTTESVSSEKITSFSAEDAVPPISPSVISSEEIVVEEAKSIQESRHRWIWMLCVFIVILVPAAFFGGYFLAKQTLPENVSAIGQDSAVVAKPVVEQRDVAASPDTLAAKHDSLDMGRHAAVEQEESAKSKDIHGGAAEEQASAEKSQKTDHEAGREASTSDEDADYRKYERMDARVRTGAYRIIGTSEVKTVKAGETLERISRRTLGEGMECYIEVYNGIGSDAKLKEGQKIKIPKLVLKKAAARK